MLDVASPWSKRKGLDDFIALSQMLDDGYAVVLVGLSKKQIVDIPKSITGIKRMKSPQELVKIYSNAAVFLNPSREENYGMTTAEAIACGTKAIVYEGTAGEEVIRGAAWLCR